MAPLAYQLCIALDPSTSGLEDPAACRLLARTVLECGEPFGLLAFRATTDELRALVEGPKDAAENFARHLRICLAHRMEIGTDFQTVRFSAVDGPRQLRWQLMFILRGPARVEVDVLAEASNLLDLVGLRLIGRATRARLRRLLPGFDPVSLRSLLPVRDFESTKVHPDVLPDAAAGAACVPHLGVRGRDARSGLAALHLARVAVRVRGRSEAMPKSAVAELLRDRQGQALVEAVVAQARLRSALLEQERGTAPGPRRSLRGSSDWAVGFSPGFPSLQ
jgi:hypothetical protein